MTLNRFGRAAAIWVRCSMAMAMAVGCGSGSSLPSQGTDERLMAQEASLRAEDGPNPFVFTFDDQLGPVYFVPDGPDHHNTFAVPRVKAVAAVLSQINNDYPWPVPALHPAPCQSLFDLLSEGLPEINDKITALDVTGEDS